MSQQATLQLPLQDSSLCFLFMFLLCFLRVLVLLLKLVLFGEGRGRSKGRGLMQGGDREINRIWIQAVKSTPKKIIIKCFLGRTSEEKKARPGCQMYYVLHLQINSNFKELIYHSPIVNSLTLYPLLIISMNPSFTHPLIYSSLYWSYFVNKTNRKMLKKKKKQKQNSNQMGPGSKQKPPS